jgi:phosphoribosylformimino-5-aminoimidazole carboxamide ribotide isomerase
VAIELYPAVDLLGGKAVRLERGDYERSKVYDAEPLDAARRWVEQGARRLHIVDLDGAREGEPVNLDHLRAIAASVEVPIQYGGGLRSLEATRAAIDAGAARVVLGTAAFKNEAMLKAVLAKFGDRVAVSVDVRMEPPGGALRRQVAMEGWVEQSTLTAGAEIWRLRQLGVGTIIYTNIDDDGTLAGVNADDLQAIAQDVGNCELIWSGGVGSLEDLRMLALGPPNLAGVIVGKALYEGVFDVRDALKILS